ncbi:hypothetical protein [Roseobacter denitrificans]|uniref:Uncharacterized protein n=1 Tax=Roseobacter denitrificans (strain ATCC 33942 / OCh 114) TaxID=375451 RepID=Q166F0_ROSDO|nr:hypothetical protein [Roseobacter denitrificans]ABG32143.1 hypothetical protein RD1_2592 [Roseobacter denitrificans OCh 114]SFF77909.1 hypothetical protein SAMN05443635_102104 [Roseobacter denitrificans OCh 114]
MQTVQNGYRGLSLLIDLNWDRALYVSTVTLSLGIGAWMATLVQ